MIGNGRAARTFRIHIALQVVGAPAGIAMNHVFGAAMPYVRFWLAVAALCSLFRSWRPRCRRSSAGDFAGRPAFPRLNSC
jgi:hypothetical protein